MVGAAVGVLALVAAACGSSSSNAGNTGSSNSGTSKSKGSSGTTKTKGSSGTGNSGGGSGALAGLYGHLPPTGGTPTNGGTVTIGEVNGATPEYIFPITPGNLASVYTDFVFQDIMWEPIYWSPNGQTPEINKQLSIANTPKFSDGNKTVTVSLKPGYTWSGNHAPVDAQDVVFFLDLIKAAVKESASNWNNYTPGGNSIPDNLASFTATGKYTLVLKLKKAFNPSFFALNQLSLLVALPSTYWNVDSTGGAHLTDYSNPAVAAKIYNYLAGQSKSLAGFGTNPLWKDVDGPYQLESFNATNGDYVQKANMSYGGPKPHLTYIKAEAFTTSQALFNQLRTGTLDFAGFNGELDPSEIPQFSELHGYSTFGYPDFGFEDAFFNFENTTNHFNKVIGQLYIRQVMAYLEDQPGYIQAKGIYDKAGGPDYGPIPAIPASPYAPSNATTAPYPYSPAKAEALLKGHGWSVKPQGVDTCIKPGIAAGDCGAGIPAGTPLSFGWEYGTQPPLSKSFATAYAQACAQVGIKLNLSGKTFNYLITNDDDQAAPANKNNWDIEDFGGLTQNLYPTTFNALNATGTFNEGAYADPKANKLILQSVFGNNSNAVKNEAAYLTQDVPVLFQPNPDILTAVKNTLGGTQASFLTTTQDVFTPQFWYLKSS